MTDSVFDGFFYFLFLDGNIDNVDQDWFNAMIA